MEIARRGPEKSAQIDGIALTGERGFVEARIGLALELYFMNGDTAETRLALCGLLREYHASFADRLSHFLKVDANRLTRISGEDYLDYYEERARTMKPEEAMDMQVYGYPDKKIVDEPTPFSFSSSAAGPAPLLPLGISYVCAYFPAAFLADKGYEALIDITRRWAAALDALHGSAGYSVLFEHGVFSGGGIAGVLPALKRFPGLDFSDPARFQVESGKGDGRSIKSVNWLTVLGKEIVQRAGGYDALIAKLESTCPIHRYEGGIVIQAGDQPQLGDVNRGIVLDDYRRVAQVLKPVRFEAYRRGLFAMGSIPEAMEETQNWLQRLD